MEVRTPLNYLFFVCCCSLEGFHNLIRYKCKIYFLSSMKDKLNIKFWYFLVCLLISYSFIAYELNFGFPSIDNICVYVDSLNRPKGIE